MAPLTPLEIALVQADIPERTDTDGLWLWASTLPIEQPNLLEDPGELRARVVAAVRADPVALARRQLVKSYRFGWASRPT